MAIHAKCVLTRTVDRNLLPIPSVPGIQPGTEAETDQAMESGQSLDRPRLVLVLPLYIRQHPFGSETGFSGFQTDAHPDGPVHDSLPVAVSGGSAESTGQAGAVQSSVPIGRRCRGLDLIRAGPAQPGG